MYDRELNIAVAAVREAAVLCGNVQGTLEAAAVSKKDRSPVTVADYGSQALVCSRLQEAFPNDPIIAEEDSSELRQEGSEDLRKRIVRQVQKLRSDARSTEVLDWVDLGGHKSYSDRFWTLDPIDGTKGFLRGDQYAVALALIVRGKLVVSAVACPHLSVRQTDDTVGVLMAAIAGRGTNIYRLQDVRKVGSARVSKTSAADGVRISESVEPAHTSHAGAEEVARYLGLTSPSVRMDSQAKYAIVAAGCAEIYLRIPSQRRRREYIWDHAAGSLIVQEAGGTVTDIDGQDLDFTHGYKLEQNRGVVVSNGVVHERLLEALRMVDL
jgi:HAL2 family 3'(2'),5'-bisphosphate nucleotidase